MWLTELPAGKEVKGGTAQWRKTGDYTYNVSGLYNNEKSIKKS